MLSFEHLFCYFLGILLGTLLHLSEPDFSHLDEIVRIIGKEFCFFFLAYSKALKKC